VTAYTPPHPLHNSGNVRTGDTFSLEHYGLCHARWEAEGLYLDTEHKGTVGPVDGCMRTLQEHMVRGWTPEELGGSEQ
jgi:hypothetical protein